LTAVRTTIGIDFRDDLFYVARIEHQTGRQEIKALLRLERQHLGEHQLLQGGEFVMSIPDELVMVKHLALNGHDDIELKARFELAQTLPDDPDQYLFDIIHSGLDSRYLGMAVRRDRLDDYKATSLGEKAVALGNSRYEMRAAALASGYTEFCRKSGGDLICMADFTRSAVSLAFVYQNVLIDLCYLPLTKFDPGTLDGFSKMAVELKTLVNFRTASLFSEGVTTPLSCLVISGDTVGNDTIDKLKRFFTIDINRPNVNTGFFSGQGDLNSVPLEKYLVALGLAAK
jgi:hypothetical protein